MKGLVNPFLWFLLAMLVWFGCHLSGKILLRARYALGLFVLTLAITLLSMPVVSSMLEKTLWISGESDLMMEPDYIVVLAGGYEAGNTMENDLLVINSQKRVLQGISVWKSHIDSILVFSGMVTKAGRLNDRMAQLAFKMAADRDVPAGSILLETKSINTAAHPVELIKKHINKYSNMLIVTNRWHTKRALGEFCKHFLQVSAMPVVPSRQHLSWTSFLPTPGALENSMTYIREWVGFFWYRLKNFWQPGAIFQC
jgi:uncharacterized SAM-binding protein YcdF (DUF218 family)